MNTIDAFARPEAIARSAQHLSAQRHIVGLTTVPVDDHAAIASAIGLAVGRTVTVVDGSAALSHDAADEAVRMVRRAAVDGGLAVIVHANRSEPRHLWAFSCASQCNQGRLLVIGDGLLYRLSASGFSIIHHAGPLFDAAIAQHQPKRET